MRSSHSNCRIAISTGKGAIIVARYNIIIFIVVTGKILKSLRINTEDWAVSAVGKHVVAQDALAGAGVGVCIDKPANGGVIVAGLQVIKPGFGVVVVATAAQGVDCRHCNCILNLPCWQWMYW